MKTGTKLEVSRCGSLFLGIFLSVALLGTSVKVVEGLHCQVCAYYDGEAEADECQHPSPCNSPEDVKAAKEKVDFIAAELVKVLGPTTGEAPAAIKTKRKRSPHPHPHPDEEGQPKADGPQKFLCIKLKGIKVNGIDNRLVALSSCVASSDHDPPYEPKTEEQTLTNLGGEAMSGTGFVCNETNEEQCGGKGGSEGLKCPVCAYLVSNQEEGEKECQKEVDKFCLGVGHAREYEEVLLRDLNKIKPPATPATTPEPEPPAATPGPGAPAPASRRRYGRHTGDEKAQVVCVRFDGKFDGDDNDGDVAGSVCLPKSKHESLGGGKGEKDVTDFPMAPGVAFSGKIKICDGSNAKDCAGPLKKHGGGKGGAPTMFAPNPVIVLSLLSLGLALVAGHVVIGGGGGVEF